MDKWLNHLESPNRTYSVIEVSVAVVVLALIAEVLRPRVVRVIAVLTGGPVGVVSNTDNSSYVLQITVHQIELGLARQEPIIILNFVNRIFQDIAQACSIVSSLT